MKKAAFILICCLFLAFGLVRIGVGGAMTGQLLGWWHLDPLTPAIEETRAFIADRQGRQLIGFTTLSYLVYIFAMGVILALGAIGQLLRRRWGLVLIGLYLASHAFLFVNFLTVNPKIVYLVGGTLLFLALIWLGRREDR